MSNSYAKYHHLYDFIVEFHEEHGYLPTIAEMAAGIKVSKSTIIERLDDMEAYGMVKRNGRKTRALTLISRKPLWEQMAGD